MSPKPANTEAKQKSRFKPGQSGNPSGRPQGSRNKATLALEALMEGQAEALTQKAIDTALEGDMAALRLCMERIYPPRKSRTVSLDLPAVETAAGIADAYSVVTAALGEGDISPDEANTIASVLEARRKALETAELEKRIEALEAK